ncbi:MAG TPA: response regulator [Candidatus Saccharimonadales bacterium]
MAKILIVEDDAILADLYHNTFLLGGFETVIGRNGLEGLEKAKQEKPDIIFLDIMMPKMNGLELIDKLKEDESTKNIPVVILSNFSDEKLAKEAIAKGALAYVIKSEYEPKQVIEMANGWLAQKKPS